MSKASEVLMLEWKDKRKSNVFPTGMDDNPEFLDCPKWGVVPSEGFRYNEESKRLEKIRYVENDTSILVEDQDIRKVFVDKRRSKLIFNDGFAYFYRSESAQHQIDYLTQALYCGSAARPKNCGATILYDVIDLSKKAEQANEGEEEVVQALHILYQLRKKSDGGFTYNEERIDAYVKLFNIFGGNSPSENFKALTDIAKARPLDFVSLASTFDNTIKTEVGQALKNKIISFADNVASFVDGSKIIKPFGSEKMNTAQQIEFVADYLRTSEGNEHLTEMRARLESEKQKTLANK